MSDLSPVRSAAVHLLAAWMGERFYRTFRVAEGDPGPHDAVLQQRERTVGVTVGALWDEAATVEPSAQLASLLAADTAADEATRDGAYAVWVPPRARVPLEEPAASSTRVTLANGLKGLAPGERREVRLPATLHLAKLQADGAYISVAGGLASEWTTMSEGVKGAFHLDSRAIHRLPEERAEIDIIVSRVRDRAAVLEPNEVTDVQVHDYWTVSRLPPGAPAGVTVVAAPPELDPLDGAEVRRRFRREVTRAVEQRAAAHELSVLVVIAAVAHLKDELVTAALRGMNPALYGALDLVAVVGDGAVRQVLKPRSLPWETR